MIWSNQSLSASQGLWVLKEATIIIHMKGEPPSLSVGFTAYTFVVWGAFLNLSVFSWKIKWDNSESYLSVKIK